MVKGRKIKTIDFKRLTPEKPKISVKQKGREHINRVVDRQRKSSRLTNFLHVVTSSGFIV